MLLLDINILIDVITEREGFFPSLVLLNLIRKEVFSGCISALTVTTTWYLASTSLGEQKAKIEVKKLIKGLAIEDLTSDNTDSIV